MSSRPANRLTQNQNLQLNHGLATAIQVLRYDASGLTRYLEEQAADNPHVSLGRVEQTEWLPRWRQVFATCGWTGDASASLAQPESPAMGLIAHVEAEAARLLTDDRSRRIGLVFIQALEPSGWLGRPIDAIAQEAGASVAEAEAVLQRLQRMEPGGIFARSLAECLTLQAQEAGLMDPVMTCVLAHLDLLARGERARLARMCGVDEAAIDICTRQIRSFDPKPGAQFGQGAAPVREPDVIVMRRPEGWQVSLNRSALPDITVHAPQHEGPRDAVALAAARNLHHMVANRNATLLRLATEVVKRQGPALEDGLVALAPMTMAELGKALSLHEGTVSRAVAGVSLDTPHGTLWLRALFSGAVGGTGASAAAVRARIARLVAVEDLAAPLGDADILEQLRAGGIQVTRRTVAKYRAMLQIPAAHRRRRG